MSDPKFVRNTKIPWISARRRQHSRRDAGTTTTWLPWRRRTLRRRRRRWRSRRMCQPGSRAGGQRVRWARRTSRTLGSRGVDQRAAQRSEIPASAPANFCFHSKTGNTCPLDIVQYWNTTRLQYWYSLVLICCQQRIPECRAINIVCYRGKYTLFKTCCICLCHKKQTRESLEDAVAG